MDNGGFLEAFLDHFARGGNDYCIMEVQKFACWLVADQVLM